MSMKTKRKYEEILPIAEELVSLLEDSCEKIVIAGSLRRHKVEIGDIELVVVPMIDLIMKDSVIPGISAPVKTNLVYQKLRSLLKSRLIDFNFKGSLNGPKYKKFLFKNIQVDLFLCTNENFGVQLMIRTGPADYSKQFMIELNKRDEFKIKDAFLWRLSTDTKELITNEHQLYKTVGFPYLDPRERVRDIFIESET